MVPGGRRSVSIDWEWTGRRVHWQMGDTLFHERNLCFGRESSKECRVSRRSEDHEGTRHGCEDPGDRPGDGEKVKRDAGKTEEPLVCMRERELMAFCPDARSDQP